MALLTKRGIRDIPQDAVILSESEALDYQKNIISLWKDSKDVFWLNYGPTVLSTGAFFTSFYLSNYYRTKLRLGSYGRFASYLPAIVFPTVVAGSVHLASIQKDIILNKFTCPICFEMRSVAVQLGAAVVYPAVLAPLAGFMLASRAFTYNVPLLTKDPKNVYKLYVKFTKPLYSTLGFIAIANALLAAFVTYQELRSIQIVNQKMMDFESNFKTPN